MTPEPDTTNPDHAGDTHGLQDAYHLSGGAFGPLGQYGPLGAYGPLGPYGPVVWVRPVVEMGYELSKEAMEGEYGVLGPRGPLGPLSVLGPLGLGPLREPAVEILREAEYESVLEGSSYVIGSVNSGDTEQENIYLEGDHFEDVYQIALQEDDTITVVLTQHDPSMEFDLVLLDGEEVVARSNDLPGQVKLIQKQLPKGVYGVGISLEDEVLRATGESDYSMSVVVY